MACQVASKLASGSPMPISTMLLTGWTSRSARCPSAWALLDRRLPGSRAPEWSTWATISPADRLRARPPWPVAQKVQPMPQPTWVEMQAVRRSW